MVGTTRTRRRVLMLAATGAAALGGSALGTVPAHATTSRRRHHHREGGLDEALLADGPHRGRRAQSPGGTVYVSAVAHRRHAC